MVCLTRRYTWSSRKVSLHLDQRLRSAALKRAIYGLKQASRTWNQQFHGFLTGIGFMQTHTDAGVYVNHQREGDGPIIIILYVDDITILGRLLIAIDRLKDQITKRYEVTDLGNIESYLGIRILRDCSIKRLTIDQSGYVKDILDRFGMADANPNHTPLPTGADMHLIKYDGQASQKDIKHYQSLIGSLSPAPGNCSGTAVGPG